MNNTLPATFKGLPVVPLIKDCRANLCTFDDYCTDEVSANAELCQPCNEESVELSESGITDRSGIAEASNANIFPPIYAKPYTHYSTMSGCVHIKNIVKLLHISSKKSG